MPVESGYNKRVYINMLNLVVLPVIRLDHYPFILVLIITSIEYSPSSPYTTSVLVFLCTYNTCFMCNTYISYVIALAL